MSENKLKTRPGGELYWFGAGEPLWKRVPTRTEDGRALSDFMMLIPGLRQSPIERQQERLRLMEQVLTAYKKVVVYADMNLRLNLLWVSVRPVRGICLELPAAIREYVPEARLISIDPELMRKRRPFFG